MNVELKNFEKNLHKNIPLTKYMQINVASIKDTELITKAPLEPNINDKSTGFAGSLSTLVTISAWSVCHLKVKEFGYEESMIAVIKSDTAYRAPVTKELYCKTILPTQEKLESVKKKLKEKKSASIKIKSQIIQDEKICVDYEGIYVIKV